MGSANDKDKLVEAKFSDTLDEVLGADYVEYAVCSAHRNAPELAEYVDEALNGGARLFVGIAGLAAALPGALAGHTSMKVPIIGVPLDEHGIDSCLYMPPGVPVLTPGVGKNGLKNAALAVCQMMAMLTHAPGIRDRLDAHLSGEAAKKKPEFDIDPKA